LIILIKKLLFLFKNKFIFYYNSDNSDNSLRIKLGTVISGIFLLSGLPSILMMFVSTSYSVSGVSYFVKWYSWLFH